MSIGISQYYKTTSCESSDNCPEGVIPDFLIKRYDTSPSMKVALSNCDGVMDVSDPDLAVEVNMWAKAKLKKNITSTDTTLQFADNIGLDQVLIGDVLFFDHPRSPEYMHVMSVNEDTKVVTVSRGKNSTTPISWKKGTQFYIYRIISGIGFIESVYQDVLDITGAVVKDQLTESYLIYNWKANDTLASGCYWIEFKLMKKNPETSSIFANFDSVMQYDVGSEPLLISPDIILIDDEFNYSSCEFHLSSVSAPYDYFIISEDENLVIELDEQDQGLITIIPTVNQDETISIIPVIDEGISTVSITVTDSLDVSIVNSIQSGMELKTLGNIKYKGEIIGSYLAGDYNNELVITFNGSATQSSVQYVLSRIAFVNISSDPQLKTRTVNYKLKDYNNVYSDSINFYIGINSIPSIQKLEGIDWIRRFPACGEGFLVKVVNTITKEV